jgi:hypothetical protein
MKSLRRFGCFLLVLIVLVGGYLFVRSQNKTVTLRLGRSKIQEAVSANFPMEKKEALYALALREPNVLLADGSDRIGLKLKAAVRLLGAAERTGTVAIDGAMRYEPATRQFFLSETAIKELKFEGVSAEITEKLRGILAPVLESRLVVIPLYKLNEQDQKQAALGLVLKSVKVKNGVVEARLGLP